MTDQNKEQSLTLCLQAVMAELADLLGSDQFNRIEAIVLRAGVPYPPLGTDPRTQLPVETRAEFIGGKAGTSGEHCDLNQWYPIATAPKDGTAVLLFGPKGLVEGSWECVDGGGHPENGPSVYWWTSPWTEFIDGPHDMPTHWMPFPALPVKTTCEGAP